MARITYDKLIELIKEHGKINFKGYKIDELNNLVNDYINKNNIKIETSKDLHQAIKKVIRQDKYDKGFTPEYYRNKRADENRLICRAYHDEWFERHIINNEPFGNKRG